MSNQILLNLHAEHGLTIIANDQLAKQLADFACVCLLLIAGAIVVKALSK